MIDNAAQARDLSNKSTDPKLQQALLVIEDAANLGMYNIRITPMSQMLINNLKARGFSVYNGDSVSW